MAMEDGMAAVFPSRIRTLLVDDDAKFLKSAKELLSFLNFEVVVCSNVAHALKILTRGDHDGFDFILVHAAKATASGFDFRAIIEANLLIPVIYFLPQGHKATGDMEDKLLRALQAGTYVIKKPLDANEVRSFLWKVIASRKCELETKARRGIQQGVEDKGCVHKVVKGGGRKRKCSGSNPAGGSFFACTAAATGGHPAAKGKENDNVASMQQPAQLKADGPGKKAKNSGGGEAFQLLQSNKAAMMNGAQLNFFMNAAVPPFNPSFFSVTEWPSSNAGIFAGAVYSAVPSALPPATHHQQPQQQPRAHSTIFGNNMPSAAAPSMVEFSQVIGNQQPQDVHPLLMFGSFAYQGPSPPAAEGGLFTAGSMAGGASVAAAAGAEARAYGNDVSLSFLQPPNHGAADVDGELADPAMVPQPFFKDAIDRATMEWLLSDDFDDYVGGAPPLVASNHQVPGKASNVDEPTATAGSTNAAPSMAPQEDVVVMPNGGNTNASLFTAMPNGGSSNATSFMASLVGSDHGEGTCAAVDGNHAGLTVVVMPPSVDQYEDNTPFPLRDLHGPLSEFDDIINQDFQLLAGGFTGGTAAVADDDDDDTGTSLHAVEEGDSNMDGLGNLDGLPIPYGLLENFMTPCHKNRNNVRE